MKLKEVFTPDWKKIILALVILFILFLIPMTQRGADYTRTSRGLPFSFCRSTLADVPRPPGMETQPGKDFIFWAFFLDLVIWYVVASIAVFALKKKKKFQPI